ncbi:MAG TPA: D-alanyl-D-alanine carboxypeptidase/D-alanyl-D-alanine-endopeptidase [Pyrinomonadaceae bacterium]
MKHKKFITLLVTLVVVVTIPVAKLTATAQRDRRSAPVATPSPTALASPSPPASPISAPTSSPTPAAAVETKFKTANPTKTVAELQNRITEILRRPELSPAMIGIKVVSLDTGRVLFEENSTKLLRPASNMKLYTVATALDRLTPDFRFTTSVYAPTKPDSSGVVRGDLIVFGRGDPSLAARFNNGDYFKGINDLADKIVAAGVKRVEGDLVGDESYFTGQQYGSGWEWEDLTWYYGAEVSALTVNDNALDLFVKPGPQVGKPAVITTGPPDPLLTIVNEVTTGAAGSRRQILIHRGLGKDTVQIKGSIPLDDRGYTGGIGISHPAMLLVYLLRSSLAQKGVTIKGRSRTIPAPIGGPAFDPVQLTRLSNVPPFSAPIEIATHQSAPFSLIAAQTLKPSQNLYTELILRTLGNMLPPANPSSDSSGDQSSERSSQSAPIELRQTSEDRGVEVVKSFLKTVGIRPESLDLNDGSGLSRNDMVTADSTVQLLTYMSRHRYADVFRDALPIAGVDGTLRNRFKGTVAENNLRAKTGSLSSAASLGGYVTTAAGERLVFTIMVNNYPSDVEPRTVCIDPIGVLLASFAGRTVVPN